MKDLKSLAGAELLLAVIGEALEIFHLDALNGARQQLDVSDFADAQICGRIIGR